MYDDIVLPVALTDDEDPAVERAADLARTFDATVHVVAAIDTAVYGSLSSRTAGVESTLESVAEERVKSVAERLEDEGVTVERRVGHGAPHDVILDDCEQVGGDVVVMATHGRSGLEHALLGSVTERVVRLADVPVMTVPRT